MKTIVKTASLPANMADQGRVQFGAGVGIMPRKG